MWIVCNVWIVCDVWVYALGLRSHAGRMQHMGLCHVQTVCHEWIVMSRVNRMWRMGLWVYATCGSYVTSEPYVMLGSYVTSRPFDARVRRSWIGIGSCIVTVCGVPKISISISVEQQRRGRKSEFDIIDILPDFAPIRYSNLLEECIYIYIWTN